jgi:methylmalonyl-CoA mutase
VYQEFERLSERGGVLGAMDTMYQRSKIQDESMLYEHKKHSGELPLVGVNTFLGEDSATINSDLELARSTEAEKHQQIEAVQQFQAHHASDVETAQQALQAAARSNDNVFGVLMEAVKVASLGQISHCLYAVGGEYRRSV